MVFKYGFRQFFRSKWVLTAVIFVIISFILTLSLSIWVLSSHNIQVYEESFTTIGFASQKASSVKMVESYDAALKDYTYFSEKMYESYQEDSALDFYDQYLVSPRQRPFYLAFCKDLRYFAGANEELQRYRVGSVIIFEPYETVIPDHPVWVKVVEVLWGTTTKAERDIWLCDHFYDNPQEIKAGHRYVTCVQSFPNYHEITEGMESTEYGMGNLTISTQVLPGEKEMQVDLGQLYAENVRWEEVTDEVRLKKWKAVGEAYERLMLSVAVSPMASSEMVHDFHEGMASIVRGTDISEEQYQNGDKVCLLPAGLASNNGVAVGDTVRLSFYGADYRSGASQIFVGSGGWTLTTGLLNVDGENYPVVEEIDYQVVGIYSTSNKVNQLLGSTGYGLAYNEVIVPEKSVTGDYSNNILAIGPMRGYNTVFMIPNGETGDYMTQMAEAGITEIDITFSDDGYEQLSSGMKSIRQIATVSTVVSIFAFIAALLLICYLTIQKQKIRTRIEYLMGLTLSQCLISSALGFLMVILVFSMIGAGMGHLLTGKVHEQLNANFGNSFDLAYSIGNNSVPSVIEQPFILWIPIAVVLAIVFGAAMTTVVMICRNMNGRDI